MCYNTRNRISNLHLSSQNSRKVGNSTKFLNRRTNCRDRSQSGTSAANKHISAANHCSPVCVFRHVGSAFCLQFWRNRKTGTRIRVIKLKNFADFCPFELNFSEKWTRWQVLHRPICRVSRRNKRSG